MKQHLLTIATIVSIGALSACTMSDTDTMSDAPDMASDSSMEADTSMSADTAATSGYSTSADTSMSAGAGATTGNPTVGGAAMDPAKDIVANASKSADHTTLVAAVQAAGLVDTLKGPGPFTVFAPTDAAFEALPAGTVDSLLQPSMKADLTALLTYHVVPGNLGAAELTSRIQAGGGSAELTTVEGGTLTVASSGAGVTVTDANGNAANVTVADVRQSNGVIHVVDTVLMP